MATTIKLQIPGGNATPAPPVGTALGSKGVNTRDFCLQFNALTQQHKGKTLRVVVVVHPDKKFDIIIKGEPTVKIIKEELKIKKGSSEPNRNKVGKLTKASIEKIIQAIGDNLQGFSPAAKKNIIVGTAKSMGVEIEQ